MLQRLLSEQPTGPVVPRTGLPGSAIFSVHAVLINRSDVGPQTTEHVECSYFSVLAVLKTSLDVGPQEPGAKTKNVACLEVVLSWFRGLGFRDMP